MSAVDTFHFGNCELRPSTPADEDIARAWTAADPFHGGTIVGSYWLEQSAGVDCYLLSDELGPLFFFRMERAVKMEQESKRPLYIFSIEPATRLLIQFGPTDTPEQAQRAKDGLAIGGRWLAGALATSGVGEIFFGSESKLLRRFVSGALGFTPRPDTLSRRISVTGRKLRPAVVDVSGMECIKEGAADSRPATS